MKRFQLRNDKALTRVALCVGTVIAATAIAAPRATGSEDRRGPDRYTFAMFGDLPYNALGRSQYPSLLADINASHVAFSRYDGDLKAGGDGPCADDLYRTAIRDFNMLERPLVWVPGDNDWTDCWGRYGTNTLPYSDPIERLAFERALFTATDQSLGRRTLSLTRESAEGRPYALYSENVRWTFGPIVYLGLNAQGSNDNYPYHDTELGAPGSGVPVLSDAEIQRQRDEETARKAVNLHWLAEGFADAQQIRACGVVVLWQADPNFNNEQHLSNRHEYDAYADYVDALRAETEAFAGQVALVHGDSHYFKVDRPLSRSSGGGVLANFTRVETFGARNTQWVSGTVDVTNPNLFVFEPRIVAANAQ